jgi:SOS response regulatory protein OraA/RecX
MDWKNSLYFKKILKYCGLNIRCYSEVRNKILKFDIEENIKKDILNFLVESKFVYDDSIYLEKYFENVLLNLNSPNFYKLYTKDKILFKLLKKRIPKKLVLMYLDDFVKGSQDTMLFKFFQKNQKKLASKTFKQKILFLTSRGFEYPKVAKVVKESENIKL